MLAQILEWNLVSKCGLLILRHEKVVKVDGIVLPDGQRMKDIDDEGYKYLGVLDKIKEGNIIEQFTREYKSRSKLVLRSNLHGRNKISAINTWAVEVMKQAS